MAPNSTSRRLLTALGHDPDLLVLSKYSAADIRRLKAAGHTMPDGSYPIDDSEDLDNAIRAVGRGSNNSHSAIRKYIMRRAKALGESDKIPDTWNADGSLSAD